MPVSVTKIDGSITTFDSADGWEVTNLGGLNVTKDPTTVVGTFAVGQWSDVKKDKMSDVQQQFEEALELIGLVDGGEFSNQDGDWRERADILLDATK